MRLMWYSTACHPDSSTEQTCMECLPALSQAVFSEWNSLCLHESSLHQGKPGSKQMNKCHFPNNTADKNALKKLRKCVKTENDEVTHIRAIPKPKSPMYLGAFGDPDWPFPTQQVNCWFSVNGSI